MKTFLSSRPFAFTALAASAIAVSLAAPVMLTGQIVHPLAQPRYDQGPVQATFRLGYIQMMFQQTAAQRADLDRVLAAQRDPASSDYHNWLTPEQYGDRFGLSTVDLARVTAWLASAGFTIEYTARGRDWIAFSGTGAQVQAAFHASVHRYLVRGETHFAVATEPLIPADLKPLVATLLGLDDFHPKSMAMRPAYTSVGGHSLAPGDLAAIYNINPLYQQGLNGSGESIVIVGQATGNASLLADVQQFRSNYGLAPVNIQFLTDGTSPPNTQGEMEEADLDLEWAGAIAPGATLIYVYGANADTLALDAIDQDLAPVISESFGACEANVQVSLASEFEAQAQKGNALGITWIAASGDYGAADCDADATIASHGPSVNFPASVPEITAVGGTELNEGSGTYWSLLNGANGASALGYIPEMAWNDTLFGTGLAAGGDLAATGGGASIFYLKSLWQAGLGSVHGTGRYLPDVALAASPNHDWYNIISSGQLMPIGGTSAATPVFAGIVALLNQYLGSNGVGNVNWNLYALEASSPTLFHDIVIGNNFVPCLFGVAPEADCPAAGDGYGYYAAVGYDLATGLGSVDAFNLITQWNGPSIVLSNTQVQFSWILGGSMPPSQSITVSSSGAAFTYSASTNVSWLSLSFPPGALAISVNPAGLTPGSYSGVVSITAAGVSNSPESINVTLTVTAQALPSISLSATQANFAYTVGGTAPPPQTISISNSGGGTLTWSAAPSASWINVSSASGSITISANPAGLTPGPYNGVVSVTAAGASNSPQTVSVAMTVISASSATSVTRVLPHFSVGGSFVTDFYVINSGSSAASFSMSFHGDNGDPVSLPFAGGFGNLTALSGSIPAGGAGFYEAGTPQGIAVSGSALIVSDPSITIQALFRRQAGSNYYEAAVPAASGSNEVQVPFDATTFSATGAQIYTGLAIANLDSSHVANVSCTGKDSEGNVIPDAIPTQVLNPLGHWANYLFPALNGLRGTLDCSSTTQIGAIGIRALGTDALSSLPVITLPIINSGGTRVLPDFAVGGSFVSDFYVVNTGSSAANFSISFHDDLGNPVAVPFAGGLGNLSTLSGSIPAGGAGFYEAGTPQGTALSGSALITSDPSITIQALFRRQAGGSYYEAAVPASSGSNDVQVPFDATTFSANGAQIYTGLAIANLDSSNAANVSCTAKDSEGNVIPDAIPPLSLSPLGHWANYLFPALTGKRGTLDCSSNTQIGAIGIRALGTDALSSLPVITQ